MNMIKNIYRRICLPVLKAIFYLAPIKKNRIIVDNFAGKSYGDNPKYIVNELLARNLDVEIIWILARNNQNNLPQGVKSVRAGSIKELWYLATSKVWIDNIRNHHPMKKKKGQIYLQTWHGGMGVKKVEGEATELLSPNYIEQAKYDGSIIDGINAACFTQEEQFKRCFWMNENVDYLRVGLPRNDQLFHCEEKTIELKKKYNIREDGYYVLYAPTFRDDNSVEAYKLDFEGIIKAFEKVTGKDCYIFIKLHPNALALADFIEYNDKIINGSIYSDIMELTLISDCIISDYSSSVTDALILDKPGFVCALDYEKYSSERGLLPLFNELPFPTTYTNEELIKAIESFDENEYNKKVQDFFLENPIYDKGNASQLTVDWLISKANL